MTEIAGRVALVTGGGSGIGRGLCLALAAEGASVIVADILQDKADSVAGEITRVGGEAVALIFDASDRDAVKRMKEQANTTFGKPVSLLFANAGATSFERLTEMSEQDVDWIIATNFAGVLNCVLAFYPDMEAAGDGHVVATSSAAGLMPSWVPYHAAYSGAKLGVIGMMLNLRIEASERGVGCTVLVPGGVRSGMKANNARYRPERFGGPSEGGVKVPEGFFEAANVVFRSAEDVAQMVLGAVRRNDAMVVTDPAMRTRFMDTYVQAVADAFDAAEAFDKGAR